MAVLRASYRCWSCGLVIEPAASTWRCPACTGLLDLDGPDVAPPTDQDRARPGLWRYLRALPLEASSPWWRRATMGEGATALVPLDPGADDTLAKLDFAMPTLSFKDRGAVVLLAGAAALGAERVLVDSSGNAATAVAAYAARLGLACTVFVPAATSPAKLAAVAAHGATVELVRGTRADVAAAAQRALAASDAFYASHVYNPLFHHGVKTVLYEIVDQLGRAPDTLVLPAGNGTYVLGCALAADELVARGTIGRRPRLVAVQAAACAPLAACWSGAKEPADAGTTVAEGIAVAQPPRAAQVVAAVRASGGEVVTVTDDEVRAARAWLAARGLFVEPTAAVPVAAWRRRRRERAEDGVTVVPLGGAGLKSP